MEWHTDHLVLWPVLRWATTEFLRQVHKFFVYYFGKSALLFTSNHKVYALGEYDYPRHTEMLTEPREIVELRNTKIVACKEGYCHLMVLTNDGVLYGWGENGSGQVGCGNNEYQARPVVVMRDVARVACGISHTAAVRRDGTVWCWGDNSEYQLGQDWKLDTYKQQLYVPTEVTLLREHRVVHIDCGEAYCVALTDQSRVFCWGKSFKKVFTRPTEISMPSGLTVTSLTCGSDYFALITVDGHVCYRNYRFQSPELISIEMDEQVLTVTSNKCRAQLYLKLKSGRVTVWNPSQA